MFSNLLFKKKLLVQYSQYFIFGGPLSKLSYNTMNAILLSMWESNPPSMAPMFAFPLDQWMCVGVGFALSIKTMVWLAGVGRVKT